MNISRRAVLRGGVLLGTGLAVPHALAGTTGPALLTTRPSLRPGGPARVGPYLALAGSLHDHTTDSDGDTRSEDVVRFLAEHRDDLGIDYASVTDHSDFFPAAYYRAVCGVEPTPLPGVDTVANCPPQAPDPGAVATSAGLWQRQGALAAQYRSPEFSLLRGFEWTNDQQNHLNVLLSQNWTDRFVTGEDTFRMEPFWQWLATDPVADPTGSGLGYGGGDGVGIFNHPGDKGALNWDDYALNAGAARRMALIEVHGEYGYRGRSTSDAGWYWFALARGWHVSPVMDWDWHDWAADGVLANPTPGASYGNGNQDTRNGRPGYLPGQRSLVFATSALPEDVKEALLARRTSATEIPDLWATLRGPGGEWQGSLVEADPGETIRLRVDAGSGTEALSHVEIVGSVADPGAAHELYWGDNPDWASTGHGQLTPSYVEQHRRFTVNGDATRKRRSQNARHDAPPDGAVVTSVPLSGARDSATVEVRVPDAPSPRPDGRHFFYAIAYAGSATLPARCWTGPLLIGPGPKR